jgi:hypothetical protein
MVIVEVGVDESVVGDGQTAGEDLPSPNDDRKERRQQLKAEFPSLWDLHGRALSLPDALPDPLPDPPLRPPIPKPNLSLSIQPRKANPLLDPSFPSGMCGRTLPESGQMAGGRGGFASVLGLGFFSFLSEFEGKPGRNHRSVAGPAQDSRAPLHLGNQETGVWKWERTG